MTKTALSHILTIEEIDGRLFLEFTTQRNDKALRANPSDYEDVAKRLAGKVQGKKIHLSGPGTVTALCSILQDLGKRIITPHLVR